MRTTHHLWTLNRLGRTTTCVAIERPRSRSWLLRVTCDGRRVLDARFESLGEAIAHSTTTFGAFLTRGWVGASDLARPYEGARSPM